MSPPVFRTLVVLILGVASSLSWALDTTSADEARLGYRYFSIGDIHAERPGKTAMGLMLMGGSNWPRAAFKWLAAKAGHGHIVILRASGSTDLQDRFYNDIGHVASVQTLVFTARETASDPVVIGIVSKADGIFIAGGDQSRYIRFWKDTPLNRVLDEHVRAGKPLGGTSAGLAIMGGASYGALDGGSILSSAALLDPLGDAVTIDSGFLHLPFLDNVITDTHFDQRDRQGRLIAFMVKASIDKAQTMIGLGVDEDTALCIEANGHGRVFSGNGGYAWLVQTSNKADVAAKGQALTFRNLRITGIGEDSLFDANTFAVKDPAFTSTAHVVNGHLEIRKH
jgi:cyanophycinase